MKTSVALCTYNGEEFLAEQLRSIAKQTVAVDELVICDDGSIDRTEAIIKDFSEKTPIPIKFIKNPRNLGYTKNFEQAIGLCSGDVIFLADQDDIWMPRKVEVICDFFIHNPDKDFVFTNAVLINSFGMNTYAGSLFDIVGMDKRNKKIFNDGFIYDVLCSSGRVTGMSTALRSSFVPYCLPFPQTTVFSVHDEMIAVMAAIHNKIAYIDQCLIQYRLHSNQSVGLWMLFKFPPQRWELAQNTLFWHESLVEQNSRKDLDKLRFVYKRFWRARSKWGGLKLLQMYFSGQYRKAYSHPWAAFKRDMNGIGIRAINRIKMLKNLKITVTETDL